MVWRHGIGMVTLVQRSLRGKLRRVDALAGMKHHFFLRVLLGAVISLWTGHRNQEKQDLDFNDFGHR